MGSSINEGDPMNILESGLYYLEVECINKSNALAMEEHIYKKFNKSQVCESGLSCGNYGALLWICEGVDKDKLISACHEFNSGCYVNLEYRADEY